MAGTRTLDYHSARSLAMKHAQEEVIHPRGHSNQVYARLRLDQGHPR
jgi:hypothetical protein